MIELCKGQLLCIDQTVAVITRNHHTGAIVTCWVESRG